MQIPTTLLPAFAESFGGRPRLFRAPGRVNLIGEHLGMWICHGASAAEDPEQPYAVALEPCMGRPDDLAEAMARGESD
jgi:hypothetical protein